MNMQAPEDVQVPASHEGVTVSRDPRRAVVLHIIIDMDRSGVLPLTRIT
jgi:hypothetical protein